MSQTLVLYWTDHEATALVATRAGGQSTIEAAKRVPLEDDADPSAVARALRTAVGDYLSSKPTVVVLAGGPDVQYRLLSLPPAPLDDVVDMVQMQAESEFASVDDGSRLDFAALTGDETAPNQVLLARLASRTADGINQTLDKLQVDASHVIPVGVASSWFARRGDLSRDNHLLVAPGEKHLDLALVHDGQLSLGRRVDFHDSDDTTNVQKLVTPIRRTMAASSGQLPGEAIRSIAWIGDLDASSLEALESALGIPVAAIDVTAVAQNEVAVGSNIESCDGFGPHVGALAGLVSGELDVDFVNPKRRSVGPSKRRLQVLGAVAAVVCIVAPGLMMYSHLAGIRSEAAELEAEHQTVAARAEELQEHVDRATAVDGWLATDIIWLDELHMLSERIRPLPLNAKDYDEAGDVMVDKLILQRPPGAQATGGQMTLSAAARDLDSFAALDSRLRDESRSVEPGGFKTIQRDAPYSRKSDATIYVAAPREETSR